MSEPLYHAKWIKLWADGAKIQYKTGAGNWVDVVAFNSMATHDIEYRVKPEEPWKPKDGERYYYFDQFFKIYNTVFLKGNVIDQDRIAAGNFFCSHEAAERVIAALKGVLKISAPNAENFQLDGKDAEIKALKEELETLKIRCENLHKAKEQLIASHVSVDDVTLTGGEIALIRALRKVRVRCVFAENSYLTYIDDDGKLNSTGGVVAFDVSIFTMKYNEQIRAALKQIKQEQEASNEA